MRRLFIFPIGLASSCLSIGMYSPALTTWLSEDGEAHQASTSDIKQTKTYIWGNGVYQPRPDASSRFRNFEPKLIKTFQGPNGINLKDITFGEYHECGIDMNGDIFIWDKHSLDSSYADGDNERKNVHHFDNGKDNKQVTFSKGNLWILKENGEVYQHVILTIPGNMPGETHIELLQSGSKVEELKDIVQIESGNDHFVALDKNGHVWVGGDDTLGNYFFLLFYNEASIYNSDSLVIYFI